MDDRLSRFDLRLGDFVPDRSEVGETLFYVGFGYYLCISFVGWIFKPASWIADAIGHPIPPELRPRIVLGGGALIGLPFLLMAIWDAGTAKARQRKRERLTIARAKELAAEKAAREAEQAKSEVVATSPAKAPPVTTSSYPQSCLRFGPPEEPKAPPPEREKAVAAPPVSRRPELVFSRDDDEPGFVAPGPGLRESEWRTASDASTLLEHAIPRIPIRHTCLVLAHLAEVLWLDWERKLPADWRPALCLATLRAWCFNEATLAEVDAAREEARLAWHRVAPGRSRLASPYPAFAAVSAIRSAALYPGCEWLGEVNPKPALEVVRAFITARSVEDAKAHATNEAHLGGGRVTESPHQRRRAVQRRVSAYLADLIRQYVPYPSRRSTTWLVSGSIIYSGDAVLTVDGWRIVQAVSTRPRIPTSGWN
jgi:hypothetical protein